MNPKSRTARFFDFIDSVDRHLYGRKMKNFIIGSLLVVLIAPLLDEFLEVPHDRLTFYATLTFLFYSLLLFLAWLSSFRDENGKWTWKKVIPRLITYFHILKNAAKNTRTNSRDEWMYKLAWLFMNGAICWKALQNLSVFVRKPVENFLGVRMVRLRNFESIARHWYLPVLFAGILLMAWLVKNNKQIWSRIRQDLLHFLGYKKTDDTAQYATDASFSDEMVISTQNEAQISKILSGNSSTRFGDFVQALRSWHPRNCQQEHEYQNSLLEHLNAELPDSLVEDEFPIPDPSRKTRKRGDIVIDKTILVEMKRETTAGEIQRAQGQIHQYTTLWNKRGPVVLLLCNQEYEKARDIFEPTMRDLQKLNRPALTIVQAH